MQLLNTINYYCFIYMPSHTFVNYKFFQTILFSRSWFGSFISSVNYFKKVNTNKRKFKKVDISNFTTFIINPFLISLYGYSFPLLHSTAGRFYFSAMVIYPLQLLIGTTPATTFDKLVNIFEHIPSVVAGYLFAIKQLYINLKKYKKLKKETKKSIKESV